MLRSRRGNFHAAHVIRLCLPSQDSLDFLKLTAHFLNHFFRGAADGIHGQPAEHEGHHGPHEETHENLRVHQGYLEIAHEIRQGSSGDFGNLHAYGVINFVNGIARGLTPVKDGNLQFFNIGGQKSQCRQSGGTDGEALARGGCRVAQGIQGIRAAAHFRIQFAHLRITPGVVGNGAVSVRRQCQAQRGKHADGGNADAIQPLAHFSPGEMPVPGSHAISQHSAHDDSNYRNAGGNHADADTGNNDGGRPRLRAVGDFTAGIGIMGGVMLRALADDDAHRQTGDDSPPDAGPVIQADELEQESGSNGYQEGTQVDAAVQGCHQLRLGSAALHAHRVHAQQRKNSAEGGDQHGRKDGLDRHFRNGHVSSRAQSGGSQNGTAVRFVKVRTHAGHVPNIIAHVIRNGGGVAGIVLRNAGLHLPHQVGSHIRRLGENAAAHTGKQRL